LAIGSIVERQHLLAILQRESLKRERDDANDDRKRDELDRFFIGGFLLEAFSSFPRSLLSENKFERQSTRHFIPPHRRHIADSSSKSAREARVRSARFARSQSASIRDAIVCAGPHERDRGDIYSKRKPPRLPDCP